MTLLEIIQFIFITLFLAGGIFFYMVGVLGLVRLPDVFTRMHATTKCDTMGAGLILIALVIWQGFTYVSLNILVVLIFIWLTNPTAAHYIAKSAYISLYKREEK